MPKSHWRRLCSLIPVGILLFTSAFTFVPSSGTPGPGPMTAAQLQSAVNSAGNAFSLPVMAKATVVQTPSWALKNIPAIEKPSATSIIQANCVQPPKSAYTNPQKLTAAQVAYYGFPPKSLYVKDNEIPQWKQLIAHMQHRSCLATRMLGVTFGVNADAMATGTHIAGTPENEHTNNQNFTNGVWAGYHMGTCCSTTWQLAEGAFSVGDLPADYFDNHQTCWQSPSDPDACDDIQQATWSGLCGPGTYCRLVQAGIYQGGTDTLTGYYSVFQGAFVEDLGCYDYPDAYGCDSELTPYYGIAPVNMDFSTIEDNDSIYTEEYRNGVGEPATMVVDDSGRDEYGTLEYGPQPPNAQFQCELENNGSQGVISNGVPSQINNVEWTNCTGEDSNGYHHSIGSSNNYGYTQDQFWGRADPGTLEETVTQPCGSGCGDGGFDYNNNAASDDYSASS